MRRLQIILTQNCNSDCSYCMVNRDCSDFSVSIDDIDLTGFDQVLLFGGEPLLRKDLCDQIRDKTLAENKEIVLLTNSLLLTDEIIQEYPSITISSNGTKETCEITGQKFNPKILEFKHKEKCFIGMRIIPKTVDRMFEDFMYFWQAGYRKFNITPIIEMDWNDEDLAKYETGVRKISVVLENRQQVWNWIKGGVCIPFRGTACIDQEGKIWACARYFSEKIDLKSMPDIAFKKCMNCSRKDYCIHNCNFINYIKTGSITTPYDLICKFAGIYERIFKNE